MKKILFTLLLLPFYLFADDHSASAPVETWNHLLSERGANNGDRFKYL